MKMLVQQKIQLGFAVALVLLLLTGGIMLWSVHRNVEQFRQANRAHEVRDMLEATLVEMLNTETGSRGLPSPAMKRFCNLIRPGSLRFRNRSTRRND